MKAKMSTMVKHPWWTITLLALLLIMSLVDRIILSLLIRPLRETFQITDLQFGLLFGTSFAILYGAIGFPAARIADTGNRKRLIAYGALLWSLCTIASGFAQSFEQLLILRAGLAVGEAAIIPASHSIIADILPRERRSFAASVIAAAPFFGAAITYIGGSLVVSSIEQIVAAGSGGGFEPWRLTLIAVSLPTLALLVLFGLTVSEPERRVDTAISEDGNSAGSLREMLPFFVPLVIGAGAPMIVATAYAAWGPELLMAEHNFTLSQAGIWFGLASAPGPVIGSLLLPALVQRQKGRSFLDALLLVCMVAVIGGSVVAVAAPLQPSVGLLLVGNLVGSVLLSGTFSAVVVSMQHLAPERHRATLVASLTFVGSAMALSIGPPLVGFLKERFAEGYGQALSITTALACLTSLLALSFARRAKERGRLS